MTLIWATRGRSWGFRFIHTGGAVDPLPVYDDVFSGFMDELELCRRVGKKVALRFPDPLGRKDLAGRIIPHEFVVSGSLAEQIHSVEDGLRLVWPLVAAEYERTYDDPQPLLALGP